MAEKSRDISVRKDSKLVKPKILDGYRPGDMLIKVHGNSVGEIYKVLKVLRRKTDPALIVVSWDGQAWEEESETFTGYSIRDCIKFEGDPATIDTEVLQAAADPETTLGQILPKEESDDTQLAVVTDGTAAKAAEYALQCAMNKALVAKAVMERKAEEINSIVSRFQDGLTKVQKVLHVAKLYLGIGEEIVQIRDGEPAGADVPISIRQMILYMDEEVGITENQGLDWQNLEDFDTWILQERNVDIVLPETRGVVALQVRRNMKTYHDLWAQMAGDDENSKTYLLIRNGQRLYRIWMNEHVHPRLFPRRDELKPRADGDSHYDYWEQRDLPEKEFQYKKYGVILQGIIQRTDVFYPLPPTIDVFHVDKNPELIRFIRDDEMLLPDGRMSWKEWRKKINAEIQIGSRIIWIDKMWYERDKSIRERTGWHGHHSAPESGLYTVTGLDKGWRERNQTFMFLYNPGQVWREDPWDKRPRMKRVSFRFYMDEALNYDQIDLDDIDFYLHCRSERKHYLDMLQVLRQVRKTRLAEMEHERGLVTLLAHELDVAEDEVWKTIEWWKLKNKWKRSVSEDDAKAVRMIRRRLKANTLKG